MEAPAAAPQPAPASTTASGAKLRIYGPRRTIADAGTGATSVNTTSQSHDAWSTGLSPFYLGPVPLWDGMTSTNVENAWQYCKVYKEHLDANGEPSQKCDGINSRWQWAKEGWANPNPVRFPMGRGAKPEYSYWNGRHLGYIEARKEIYAPLYASAVVKSAAFQRLKYLYHTSKELHLWDFDGYDYTAKRMTLNDVINERKWKMGHAFVLAMLLTNQLCWNATPELRAQLASVPNANPAHCPGFAKKTTAKRNRSPKR